MERPTTISLPPRVCEGCGADMDTGYWQGNLPVYEHAIQCDAYGQQIETAWAARLEDARQDLFRRQSELPKDAGTLADYGTRWTIDDQNRDGVTQCREFEGLCAAAATPQSGFTLYGRPGTGKTTLMAALAGSVAALGIPLLFINMPEEMEAFKARFRGDGGGEARLAQMARVKVLILDDVGRERPGPWSVDQVLYPIINSRIRGNRPTLCTTNETPASLRAAYESARGDGERPRSGAAVVDRLCEVAPWVPMGGETRRSARSLSKQTEEKTP